MNKCTCLRIYLCMYIVCSFDVYLTYARLREMIPESRCCVAMYSLYLTIVILQSFYMFECVFVKVCPYLWDLCACVCL